MEQGFLDRIAKELVAEFGNDMAKALVILPNRRSAVFLKKAIAKQMSGAVLLPRMQSIQDQVETWSRTRIVSPTELLLRFFTIHQQVSGSPNDSLQNFLRWAGMFLTDIDEMDLELIDHAGLFDHLLSAERIASWDVGESGPTEFQTKHLKFIERFEKYYSALQENLKADGLSYRGMAYSTVVSEVDSILMAEADSMVWFVGFNALHEAEKRLINAFMDEGNGRCFWDADSAYLNDGGHEAGKFLRQNRRAGLMDNGLDRETNGLATLERTVNVVAANGSIGQVGAAAKLLAELSAKPDFQPLKTAIVLNDESQLIPLIHALPAQGDPFNITLGYPIRFGLISQFIDALFRLHLGAEKYSGRYHFRDVLLVFRHPFAKGLNQKLVEAIIEFCNQKIYLDREELLKASDDLPFLREVKTSQDGLNLVSNALGLSLNENDGVERAVLDQLTKILAELTAFLNRSNSNLQLEDVHLLWRQLVRSSSVSFAGEPLQGIQVMGMLETRLLDFDTIIMIGCNEGTLPRSSTSQTFIPFDIRKAFGMQTHLDKDAVFSYHFYRLLQRSGQVSLLYDSNSESFGKGEPSRFIQQLKVEKPSNTWINEFSVEMGGSMTEEADDISVPKGEFELDRINEYLENGISPSGINVFGRCELMFYYRYVLSLGEGDEINEHVDHAEFGTAVHDALENLYKPLIDRPLTSKALEQIMARSDRETESCFSKMMKDGNRVYGKNLLAQNVAMKYVKRAIQADLNYTQEHGEESLTVTATEGKAEVELASASGKFKLKGTIDRLDLTQDGTLRILDYKTGKVEAKDLKLDSIEDLNSEDANPKALQLLSYGLMIKDQPKSGNVALGIIPLRGSGEPLFLNVEKESILQLQEVQDSGIPVVKELVGRIADPSRPFEQTEDLNVCQTCSYRGICNR